MRFFFREMLGTSARGAYALAETGGSIVIRHHTSDLEILAEVFGWRLYEPPPEVLAVLPRNCLTVLDLGAHIGMFGLFARYRFPGCRIEAFEPDPANREVLEACIQANSAGDEWTLVGACAGADNGEVSFALGQGAAGAIDTQSPHRVPIVDVLPRIAKAHLVKLDIEGGEWPILQDPRFRRSPPRAIVLEIHPRGAPAADYVAAAIRLLDTAGLQHRQIPQAPAGAAMLWAWCPSPN
jgi:FkbM family methyltransferase